MGCGRDQQVLENLTGILKMGSLLLFRFGVFFYTLEGVLLWEYMTKFLLYEIRMKTFCLLSL